MAILGFLLSGTLSIILWFEVTSADELTSKERAAFIGGAIVETLFFLISSVGLIGVIVRKQTFVTAYAVGLYVHFLLNLGVAGYLLSVIVHATRADINVLCQHAINNTQGQDQCSAFFNTIRDVYAALASLILIIELYGAIVATRYVYQIRAEKCEARREACIPRHMRAQSSAARGQLSPGIVCHDGVVSGTKVYSAFYQDLVRAPSAAYSPAGTDFEGATPTGLYDPPTAGPSDPKYHAGLDFEDRYKEEGYGFKDVYSRVAPHEDEKTLR